MLFLQLIGPLLIAAVSRKTYETTMAGTIIAVCNAVPIVLGYTIGNLLIVISNLFRNSIWREVLALLVSFLTILPFIIPAVSDLKEWQKS